MPDDTPELPGAEDLKDPFGKKPKGMPPVSLVREEAARMGLPQSDGDYMFDVWLSNGFRTKTGPIKDWRASFRTYFRSRWLPSQKVTGYQKLSAQDEALRRIKRAQNG